MKIKNILACSCFVSAMLFHSIAANAAVISKFPYFQDFESVGDVTLSDSLWDESQTPLDCVFHAQGDELTVGEDEEHPEYGKSLKHISKGNKEKFIMWRFPNKTEGIVLISLDIKNHDERMLYMKFTREIWDPILKMNDDEYMIMDYPDIGKSGQYSKDEWNHVEIVVNLDENLKTISFNGDEYTSEFTEAALSEFYIQMQPDTMPESEFTEVFVDNIRIEAMDNEADVKLYSGDEEIKSFTDVTDEVYFKITDNEGDCIQSLLKEDIIFRDLGDNRIAVEESDVDFEVKLEDKKLKLDLKSELKDGHRYQIILPEDTKTRFTRGLSHTEFEFLVRKDVGMIVKEKGEDFSEISELADVKRGEPIAEGSLLKYYSAKSSSKTYELIEDTDCTDGKGIKLKGDRVLAIDLSKGENIKSGEYEIEVRYKVNSGAAKVSIANSSILSGISLLETTKDENTLYNQYDNIVSGIKKTYLPATGDWTVAKLNLKLDDKILSYDIDGQQGEVNMPYYDSSSKQNIMTDGIEFIRFEQSEKGSAGEVILDYIIIRSKTEAANVSKVIFTDTDENADVYISGSKLPADIKSIEFYFTGVINEENLGDISISNGDVSESFDISYNKASNICVLNLNNYLNANSEYEIIIPESVTGQEIKGKIVTDSGAYEVKAVEFLDQSGNKTENISLAESFRVSIINTLGESKRLSMVYSSHEGYYLKNMSFKNIEVTSCMRKAEFVMPINVYESATKLQGFLVSDINSLVPKDGYVQLVR